MSATIAKDVPRVEDAEDEFDEEDLNHYVLKADITESIVTGKRVSALCGVAFVVTPQGDGQVANGRFNTCLDCEFEYAQLPGSKGESG